jgi:NAD(P)H-hydrate epimerase
MEMDRRATDEFGIPSICLMENAGRALAEAAFRLAPGGHHPIAILCGAGNNGGDGFVAARHLHNRGVNVEVLTAVEPGRILAQGGDAAVNLNILQKMDLFVHEAVNASWLDDTLCRAKLLVDCIFGTGLTRAVDDIYRDMIDAANRFGKNHLVVSCDIPSGIHGDTGQEMGVAVHAFRTVTFTAKKPGLGIGAGVIASGEIEVVDIGVPRQLVEQLTN